MSQRSIETLKHKISMLIEKREYQQALSALLKLSDEFPGFCNGNFYYCYTLGDVYFALECFDKAVENFSIALRSSPEHVSVLIDLAKTHIKLRDLDSAEKLLTENLEQMIELDWDSVKYLYIQLAEIAHHRGDKVATYQALEKAEEYGAMDLDVMDSAMLYETISSEPEFEQIFDL